MLLPAQGSPLFENRLHSGSGSQLQGTSTRAALLKLEVSNTARPHRHECQPPVSQSELQERAVDHSKAAAAVCFHSALDERIHKPQPLQAPGWQLQPLLRHKASIEQNHWMRDSAVSREVFSGCQQAEHSKGLSKLPHQQSSTMQLSKPQNSAIMAVAATSAGSGDPDIDLAAAQAAEDAIPHEAWTVWETKTRSGGVSCIHHTSKVSFSRKLFKRAFENQEYQGYKLLVSVWLDGQRIGGPLPARLSNKHSDLLLPAALLRAHLGRRNLGKKAAPPSFVQLHLASESSVEQWPEAAGIDQAYARHQASVNVSTLSSEHSEQQQQQQQTRMLLGSKSMSDSMTKQLGSVEGYEAAGQVAGGHPAPSAAAAACSPVELSPWPLPAGYQLPNYTTIDEAEGHLRYLLSIDHLHCPDDQMLLLDYAFQQMHRTSTLNLEQGCKSLGKAQELARLQKHYQRIQEWVKRKNAVEVIRAVDILLVHLVEHCGC